MKRTHDTHPALAIKQSVLARSGVYYYTKAEMIARGLTPKIDKPLYAEYRPKDVVARAKDKFAFAVVTKEHTDRETTPENFQMQASGIIGDNIIVRDREDGEIELVGNISFHTRDVYDHYMSGNKETSADYKSVVAPDSTGQYDFVLKEILSVNGLAVTARGRGGKSVRVLDSLRKANGGNFMSDIKTKKGVLSFLGIGRSKDEAFSLSKLVLDGAKSLHTLDAAGKETLVNSIMEHITDFAEGDKKDTLVGAVKDSLNHPIEAIAQSKDVARVLDGLYAACVLDEKKASEDVIKDLLATKDSEDKDDDDKDKEGEKDKPPTKDSGIEALIEAALVKHSTRVLDGIDALIDKKIKESLGIKTEKKEKETLTQDGGLDYSTREDGSFILDGQF